MTHKALVRRLQISCLGLDPVDPLRLLVDDVVEALREHAMREVQRLGQEIEQEQECWCTTCRPISMADMRFVVCPDCGNKRCPKANDHRNDCTNSNEVGQKGSSWEHVKPLAQPEQDHIPDARKMVTEQEPVVGITAIRTWFKDGRVVTQTLCNSWVDTTPPQPEQEPVAWMSEHRFDELRKGFTVMTTLTKQIAFEDDVALYTTPPQRKPLTDEEIAEFAQRMEASDPTDSFWREFARAIEAFHNIREIEK